MRCGWCIALSRLCARLVMNTVLPARLKPVTASETVELWTKSAAVASQSVRSAAPRSKVDIFSGCSQRRGRKKDTGCRARPEAPVPSGLEVDRRRGGDEVDPVLGKRPRALLRPVDDRLLVHVEARIDQHREAGGVAEPAEDSAEQRI